MNVSVEYNNQVVSVESPGDGDLILSVSDNVGNLAHVVLPQGAASTLQHAIGAVTKEA